MNDDLRSLELLASLGDEEAILKLDRLKRRVHEIPWTSFADAHTEGYRKLQWDYIFIQAFETQAIRIFIHRFLRHPLASSCANRCCGPDYSVTERDPGESLEEITEHYRKYPKTTLEEFVRSPKVLVIPSHQIKDADRLVD